jgi:hypothetical protein
MREPLDELRLARLHEGLAGGLETRDPGAVAPLLPHAGFPAVEEKRAAHDEVGIGGVERGVVVMFELYGLHEGFCVSDTRFRAKKFAQDLNDRGMPSRIVSKGADDAACSCTIRFAGDAGRRPGSCYNRTPSHV